MEKYRAGLMRLQRRRELSQELYLNKRERKKYKAFDLEVYVKL